MDIRDSSTGQVLHSSRNLRGVLDYSRKHPIVAASYNHERYMAMFEWDGAYCYCNYADPNVFEWFLKQRRSWGKWVYKARSGPWTTYYYHKEEWMDELPR